MTRYRVTVGPYTMAESWDYQEASEVADHYVALQAGYWSLTDYPEVVTMWADDQLAWSWEPGEREED